MGKNKNEKKLKANRAKLAVPATSEGFAVDNYERVKEMPYKNPSVSKEKKGKA